MLSLLLLHKVKMPRLIRRGGQPFHRESYQTACGGARLCELPLIIGGCSSFMLHAKVGILGSFSDSLAFQAGPPPVLARTGSKRTAYPAARQREERSFSSSGKRGGKGFIASHARRFWKKGSVRAPKLNPNLSACTMYAHSVLLGGCGHVAFCQGFDFRLGHGREVCAFGSDDPPRNLGMMRLQVFFEEVSGVAFAGGVADQDNLARRNEIFRDLFIKRLLLGYALATIVSFFSMDQMMMKIERIVRSHLLFFCRTASTEVLINMGRVVVDDDNHPRSLGRFLRVRTRSSFFQKSTQPRNFLHAKIVGVRPLEKDALAADAELKLIASTRLDLAQVPDQFDGLVPTQVMRQLAVEKIVVQRLEVLAHLHSIVSPRLVLKSKARRSEHRCSLGLTVPTRSLSRGGRGVWRGFRRVRPVRLRPSLLRGAGANRDCEPGPREPR